MHLGELSLSNWLILRLGRGPSLVEERGELRGRGNIRGLPLVSPRAAKGREGGHHANGGFMLGRPTYRPHGRPEGGGGIPLHQTNKQTSCNAPVLTVLCRKE